MAEIRDQLVLDVDQALTQINNLERSLDRALGQVEVRVDADSVRAAETSANQLAEELGQATTQAVRLSDEASDFEARLRDAERGAARLTTEVQSIALNMGRAEGDVRDLARALDISEDEARQLAAEVLDAQAAANRLEDAARATARSLGLADEEADRFVRSLQRAARESDDINVRTGALVTSFGNLRSVVTGVVSAIGAIGIGRGIALAARGAQAAVNQFAALNESINAVNVTFEEGADAVFAFGQTSAQAAGLSAQAFQQAVVPIGSVLRNFGFDARDAAAASIELVQRAADLASVFNTDVNEALLAINSALVGQVEPLRRYGAEISQARVEAFALATGLLQAGEEMDTATAVQARFGLILADTNRVAGDFVRTSEDYANATRTARAEVEEFSADIGEALLPAFEGLVNIVPELIDGLRFLIPTLGESADATRDWLDALNVDETGAGNAFLGFIASVQGGVGTLTDAVLGFGDLAQVGFAGFVGRTDLASAALANFNQRIENTTLRIGSSALADDITRTGNRLFAFGNALGFVGRETENIDVFAEAFRRFGTQANLSTADLRLVIPQIIDQAQQLGLSSTEVDFLTDALLRLDISLVETEPRLLQIGNAIEEFGGPLQTAGTRFTTFITELEEVPPRLATVAAGLSQQSDVLADSLNPFERAAEDINVSAQEFFDNLEAQINQAAQFQADVARLVALGFDDVATEIAAAGPGAAQAAREFLENLDLARQAEALLDGEGTAIATQVGDELADTLRSAPLTSEVEQAFLVLISEGFIDNPQVLQAIAGTGQLGQETVSVYRQGIIDEAQSFNVPGLEDAIAAAFESDDLLNRVRRAGEEVGEAFEQGTRRSLQIESPSKVFMEIGQLAAQGFALGFDSLPPLAIPQVAAVGVGAAAPTVVGGGIEQNFIFNDANLQDPISEVARISQLAGAEAVSLRNAIGRGLR